MKSCSNNTKRRKLLLIFESHYNYIKNKPIILLYLFIILSVTVNFATNFIYGPFAPLPANDTGFYIRHAEIFLNQGFTSLSNHGLPVYYWGYPLVLSIFMSIFGEGYPIATILFQIILTALTTLSIYSIGKNIFSVTSGLISAGLYVFTWEIFRWSHFILTDALYISLFIITINLCILFSKTKSTGYLLLLFLLSTIIITIRSPAVVLILIIAAVLFSYFFNQRKYRNISAGSVVILITATLLFLLTTSSPESRFSLYWWLDFFTTRMAQGIIISGNPAYDIVFQGDLDRAPLFTKFHFYLSLVLKRLAFFWAIYISPHSLFHKIFNLIWLLPLFGFALLGFINTIKSKIKPSYILCLILFAYTIFHALTNIDFDQRYRAPLLTIITIYSGFGISCLLIKIKYFIKSSKS